VKVVRLHASGDLRSHDEANPLPVQGELLIKVTCVGICGSDLHWFTEGGIGDDRLIRPLVLGHEFAGITERGARVAVDPAIPCSECEYCLQEQPNLCPRITFAGHGEQDGALREWMAWNEKCVYPIPDSFTDADGVMLEPLGVALHAADLGKLKIGMTVGVFGCGPIGLLIVQLARLAGARTILATDILPHRVEAAKSLGAHHALLTADRPENGETGTATVGRGLDVVFEAAGAQGAVDAAFAAVRPGGKVILAGIPVGDRTSFPASVARRKGMTIKLVRRMKHTYPRAIDLVSNGLVDVRSLVTHRFPLDQAVEAFRTAARRDGLKVIIEL
jgi:L-iditol 2-dehydrogenase